MVTLIQTNGHRIYFRLDNGDVISPFYTVGGYSLPSHVLIRPNPKDLVREIEIDKEYENLLLDRDGEFGGCSFDLMCGVIQRYLDISVEELDWILRKSSSKYYDISYLIGEYIENTGESLNWTDDDESLINIYILYKYYLSLGWDMDRLKEYFSFRKFNFTREEVKYKEEARLFWLRSSEITYSRLRLAAKYPNPEDIDKLYYEGTT